MNHRKSVVIQVPGTCGELIQTRLGSRECLVALPINRYVTAEARWVTDESAMPILRPKSQRAFDLITDVLGLLPSEKACIHVLLKSQLQMGKGMASSTADLYAVMASVVLLCQREHEFDADRYGALCARIEPTDGLMFENWTVFDHLEGVVIKELHTWMPLTIYMLYPEATFSTGTLRLSNLYTEALMRKSETLVAQIDLAVSQSDYERLGTLITQSTFENEPILSKIALDFLHELSLAYNAVGVVCAHSGTVLGIAFEQPSESFEKALTQWLNEKTSTNEAYYSGWEVLQTVKGGYQLIDLEA